MHSSCHRDDVNMHYQGMLLVSSTKKWLIQGEEDHVMSNVIIKVIGVSITTLSRKARRD